MNKIENRILIYVSDYKYDILEDYILSLTNCREYIDVKKWVISEKITIDDTYKIIIFLQVIPNYNNQIDLSNLSINNNINIYLCNTEQLTENIDNVIYNIEPFFVFCKNNYPNITFGITDYSEQNIEILKMNEFIQHNNISINYLPYQYYDDEVNSLKQLSNNTRMVSTCGYETPERKNIKEMLANEHDIYIHTAIGFKKDRDTIIGNHKIFLNISAKPIFTIYEHIRCDRWLFANKIIISQFKTNYDKLDISDLIIWCSIDSIGETIQNILMNYAKYEKIYTSNERIDKIKQIANNRKQIYDSFINSHVNFNIF